MLSSGQERTDGEKMPTFCSNCGSTLATDINFCPICGTPTSLYYSHSSSSQVDPTTLSRGADTIDQKASTDYGSPTYGTPDKQPYDLLNPYEILPPPPPPNRGWSSVFIGIISGILVSILILGSVGTFVVLRSLGRSTPASSATSSLASTRTAVLSQVPTQSCGGAFSDEFNGKLDSRWNWINPSSNATYNVATNGFLSISTPPNSDINPDSNFNAPRLLQPINGDFTVETLVKFRPVAFYQSAGILIWQDQTNFIRFELADLNRNDMTFQKDENGLFSQNLGSYHNLPTGPLALRVQRQGDHFTVSWHEPNQVWQIDGETDMHFSNPMVGLDLLATYDAPQTTAYYDYFRVSCT